MSERRFYLREQTNEAEIDYPEYTITESELMCRWNAAHVAMGKSDTPWQTALDILLHGEKEQPLGLFHSPGLPNKETDKEYCVCGKPAGHREDCWLDGKPDEWEEWAEAAAHVLVVERYDNTLNAQELKVKEVLCAIPCNPQRKP